MRDHLPLDQDEAVSSLPVSNIRASTATPQLKLGELIERTKHMARGGGETQENDRFDDKDTMVETGNYAAHQLEGLLEDLEVDIESPSRLDLLLETSQKDLEVGSSTFEGVENLIVPINFEHDAVGQTEDQDRAFPTMDSHCDSGNFVVEPVAIEGDQIAVLSSFATDNSVTAIKIGLLVVKGRENGYDGCNDEEKIKSAMLEVKPGQVFVLPFAEDAAAAPNLLSGLPGVQDSPFPTKHSSEAAFPSSAHPTNCLQHPWMSSLVSNSLLHKEPGQEQSLVTTLVLRPPRGGAPEEDKGANQLLSSFRVNAADPICTRCTGASEMLNHENTLSNTSIAEVCNLNLMSAGTLTEGFDHSDGAIASTDIVPVSELQGEHVKPGLQRGRSDETQQSLQAAETTAIDVERLKLTVKTVPTTRLQFFNHAPCTISHVSQPMTLEFQDVTANDIPPLVSCALTMFTSMRANPVLQGRMPATARSNFEEVHSRKEETACTQEPQELMALAMQAVPSECPEEPSIIPLAAHLQHKESGDSTVRCAAGPSLYQFASAPWFLKIQMRMETDKQLQQVQKSAHDAMVAATSVLEQSLGIWACIQTQYPSKLRAVRDAQIASVAATIVAAAAITKAAMEAAKAIAETSNEAFNHLGRRGEEGLAGGESVPLHLASANSNGMDEVGDTQVERHTRISGAATSEDQTKSRAISAARDAMVQPAKATSQAGDVITTGIHLLQAKAVEDAWNTKVQDQVKEMDTNLITKIHGSKAALFLEGCEGTQSPKKSAKKKKKKLKGTQASILTLNKKSDSQGGRESMSKATFLSIKHTPKMETGGDEPGIDTLLKRKTQKKGMPLLEKSCHMKYSVASSSQDCAAHKLHIMELGGGKNVLASLEMFGEDSVVEVMSAEEGLRGGWFSARVIMMADEEALVIYDDLLTDDGCSQLKEWFPLSCVSEELDCPSSGKLIRPAHPYSFSKEEQSRKRHHIATSLQAWIVGDHVDAFIQDVWWEGVVKELNEDDISKLTVYFPGEDDTAVVNARDLRPSMIWTDGQWRTSDDSAIKEDGRPSKKQKVGSAKRKGKEEGKLAAEKPTRNVVIRFSLPNRKGKNKESKASAEKHIMIESTPAKRKCKEESKMSAEKLRRSITIELSPGNKKRKESMVGAGTPTRSMALEVGPANKKHKESQVSGEKPTISMAMELSPVSKREMEKEKMSKMSTEKPMRSMAMRLSPANRKGNKEKSMISAEKPTIKMATEISPANRKGKKGKIRVSAAKPTVSMAIEQSSANMKDKKKQSKVSLEKPAECMEMGLSPANKKDKEKSKGSAEKPAISMAMGLRSTDRKDKEEKQKDKEKGKDSAEKPAFNMAIQLCPTNGKDKKEKSKFSAKKHKLKDTANADKSTKGMVKQLSTAGKKRKAESKAIAEKPTKSRTIELSPAKRVHNAESKLIVEKASKSPVMELSPANRKGKEKVGTEEPTSRLIEVNPGNRKQEKGQLRAARKFSPANKKHEESQLRATRSMAIEFSPANKKHEESQLRATRSIAVELIPANRKCKRGDSNMTKEKPTTSMDVKLCPVKRKGKKERDGNEGMPSKGQAVELGLPDMKSLADSKGKMEGKVSKETPTRTMAVDLSPDNLKGKKERNVGEGMPTRSMAVKLNLANMNAKKKESKVTGSVTVELSPANLKGKKKESKVSEQAPTGCVAVELNLANKGKKDSEVSTEKSRTLEQAIARASSRGLVLNSGPSSTRVSTRKLTKKYVTTPGKGDTTIVNSLANENRSVGKLPSTISDALIMPKNISLKKNEAMRVHNVIMTRMKEIAELPKSQHSSKAPSKQHSSKVAKMVCARTVSTRSEARQLRSKTSQMKIYNMLKGSTNQEKLKHH